MLKLHFRYHSKAIVLYMEYILYYGKVIINVTLLNRPTRYALFIIIVNPRRACARVTVLGLCVCPAPRVLPLGATERPTEGTYGFGAIWETCVFSRNALFKSYGVKKPIS